MDLILIAVVVLAVIGGIIWGSSGSKRDTRKMNAAASSGIDLFSLEVIVEGAAEALTSAID